MATPTPEEPELTPSASTPDAVESDTAAPSPEAAAEPSEADAVTPVASADVVKPQTAPFKGSAAVPEPPLRIETPPPAPTPPPPVAAAAVQPAPQLPTPAPPMAGAPAAGRVSVGSGATGPARVGAARVEAAPAVAKEESAPAGESWLRGRGTTKSLAYVAGLLVLLLAGGFGWAAATKTGVADAQWRGAAVTDGVSPSPSAAPEVGAITLSATGDIIMGNAARGSLPPNNGKGYFDKVKDLIKSDFAMGNLEQPITDDTGVSKCPAGSTTCFQFRVPPAFADNLVDAGFQLLNQANNHAADFGDAGFRNTQKTLDKVGLLHTGAVDEITLADVKGVRIAVVGFSSFSLNNSMLNLDRVKQLVAKAATMADIVVVQCHMGAEGGDKSHVKPGTEYFIGENRGDPMAFARAAIDAGADLIVGHSPHVLRGMEFYKGRLIAYSLGNFAGGGSLGSSGTTGWGGVLRVTINPDGSFVSGQFHSTYFGPSPGNPLPDPNKRGLKLVRDMTTADFGANAARISDTGLITPPQ